MDCKDFCKQYYVNRKNTDCIKWDSENIKDKLPMFIADMDFKTDENIINNLNKRISHGAYGYGLLPKDYYDVVINWDKKRNGVVLNKEWFAFTKGAVDAIYQVLYALTDKTDSVMIMTPVYPPFAATVKNTGRKLITSSLVRKDGLFTFDYKDIDKKIKTKNVKAIILCTPHNPLGRVWTKEELAKLLEITHKYHVLVISDEVHSDLIMPGYKFIQTLAFKKYQNEIITISAASKTFSLAIFAHCHVIIPNKKLKAKFDKYQADNHLTSVNAFNALPTYYGYKYSEEWLDNLVKVIEDNYKYFCKRMAKYVDILPLEGTYLLFVDFKKFAKDGSKFLDDECGIVTNAGGTFGKGYESWARINIATSHANIKKACDKIEKAINK